MNYFQAFKWVFSRLEPHRQTQFWVLFGGMAASALLETGTLGIIAFFASTVTDPQAVLSSSFLEAARKVGDFQSLADPKSLIIASGFVMVVMITFKNSVKALVTYRINRFGVELEAYFGEKLLDGFLKLPYEWHLNKNSADIINSVAWRKFLGSGFFQPCLTIMNNVLMVLIMLLTLFAVEPVVSIIVFVILGSTATFIFTKIRKQIDKVASIARDFQIAVHKEVTMAVQGIKDVKIAQKEDRFILKFVKKVLPLSKISSAQGFYVQLPVLILETIGFAMLYLSVYVMLVLVETSTAYVTGVMALLAIAAWKAIPASNLILGNLSNIRKSLPYIQYQIDYFSIIEANRTESKEADRERERFKTGIRFEDVCFSYMGSDVPVIRDLNFEIKKGETIGIIGKSGAGKSTLVNLLIGLLSPVSGTIRIDEEPLVKSAIPRWLKITGYVAQSPYIYDGTLAENIAFGDSQAEISNARVYECCAMASMDDFIHDLPDGIGTHIGERGVKLSGGQQQRVAIARSLYNCPEVIIFDEATSSLDTKSEKSIQETIYRLKGNHTLVIIAHRLSTVEGCDRVIWLEKGRVWRIGKPEVVLSEYEKEMIGKKTKGMV